MSTNRCKKVRSIIAMLLAVVMMTGMLPTSAFAAGEEITGADGIGNEINNYSYTGSCKKYVERH